MSNENPTSIDQEALANQLANVGITEEVVNKVDSGVTSVEEEVYAPEFDTPTSTEIPEEGVVQQTSNEEAVDTDSTVNKPERKHQNVTVSSEVFADVDWDSEADTVTLPSSFDAETRVALERVPEINLLDDPKSRDWAETISNGLGISTWNDTFIPTLENQNADFHQNVEQNNIRLGGARPKFKATENQYLTGERSVIRMMNHLGLGTLFQVPLWHTGIWITFKAPVESEIIEINRRQIADKIQFGRETYGLVFSNTSSYTTDRMVDFALEHVYDTTLMKTEVPTQDLKSIIDCQDIPSLIWGFICTMYPNGFQFRRACINDAEKCNYVTEGLLNVSKLQWVNRAALTDWQKTHMSTRSSNSKDKASILRYKEEMKSTQKRRVVFNKGRDDEIAIILKTPNIGQYVETGHRWVSELTDLVDKALGIDARDQERNVLITRHGQASTMRQYVHWVESIEIASNIINDVESIERNFTVISGSDVIRDEFIKSVIDYINDTTIAVIGVPVYDCPKCTKPQEENSNILPYHKNIIPLDVIQLFFDLLTQRLSKISER